MTREWIVVLLVLALVVLILVDEHSHVSSEPDAATRPAADRKLFFRH